MANDKGFPDISSSGDVGYCRYAEHPIGIIRTWDGHTVIEVDCDHLHCRYDKACELYQRAPVGFTQTFPNAPKD